MQPWVIDLSDARVAVADDRQLLAASPGYAIALPGSLLLGAAALANACAHPRQTINTFWSQLSTTVIKVPGANDRSAAEYVHAHLNDIVGAAGATASTPVILAAPAHFDRDRLALLLGVAAQCQFRPVGLIDAAVAAAAGIGDAPNYLYVDVGLQQTVISYLTTEDGQLQHARFEVLADMGWVALRAELTHVLSAAFVQAARFDPLRHADTERQLQAQLTDLLRRINDQPNAVELALNCEHGDRQYPISVTAGTLVAPLRQRQLLLAGALQRLAPRGTPMLLAPMAALVPGLGDLLATLAPITALSDTAVARGALEFQSQIVHDGTALPFVRRLTLRSPPAQNEPHLTSLRSHAPAFQQFALHRNKLYVLNASPLPLTQGGAAAERAIRLADGPPRLLGQLASNGATAVLLRGDGAGITVNGADAAAVVALATGDVIAAANIPSASLGSATITIVELAAPQARS